MIHHPNPTVILTGDRPTGSLHLGHYAGSLRNRVTLQRDHEQFVLLADSQALTDNAANPEKVRDNVVEVALDYLAVGIDPALSTICVQSAMPALAELSMLYLNYVSVARLERNPTVKDEIRTRGFGRNMPAGFLCYPAAQAADITAFKATLVPVGEDQSPMIEQTNELVRRLNRQIGRRLLPEAEALIPAAGRLPSLDGKSKMSKSSGPTIPLSATSVEIAEAVRQMYTDPGHIRACDPGKVEGNVVFAYLDAFDPDIDEVSALKGHYRRGGLGDSHLKERLTAILQQTIEPIRERRNEWKNEKSTVMDILRTGTRKASVVTERTKGEVFDGLKIFRL